MTQIQLQKIALHRYFNAVDILPAPNGALSSAISPAAIKDAIEAVRSALTLASKTRGPYSRHTPKHQAMIDEYASQCGSPSCFKEVGC